MAAGHHQAQRQRRRDDQADRAPQPAPEYRRDHHRQRRQPSAVAVQLRLDELRRDQLDRDEQAERLERQPPAGIDRRGQHRRADARRSKPHIGHEAQHRGRAPPTARRAAGRSAQPEPDRHADAEVDGELRHEEARQPLAGVVDRQGRAADVGAARGRMKRSRSDSCSSSTNISTISTMLAVPSGPHIDENSCEITSTPEVCETRPDLDRHRARRGQRRPLQRGARRRRRRGRLLAKAAHHAAGLALDHAAQRHVLHGLELVADRCSRTAAGWPPFATTCDTIIVASPAHPGRRHDHRAQHRPSPASARSGAACAPAARAAGSGSRPA